MKIIRLAGRVSEVTDEITSARRKKRARLLFRLFEAGYTIYNGNGDQVVNLKNIHEKIVESEGFVFTPEVTTEALFQLSSVIVGKQTCDKYLDNKAVILVNNENIWADFIELYNHLHKMGTIRKEVLNYFSVVDRNKDAISILNEERETYTLDEGDIATAEDGSYEPEITNPKPEPDYNICVFCSASIKDPEYLDMGYELGKRIADNGMGCVSGAGKTGIMGKVVAGSVENNGWAGGSNIPNIIELEGLPPGLNEFWAREDIYTRMEVMIEHSNAFFIMPGGMGTVQEFLALILLKKQNNALAKDKPVIVINYKGFWDPLIEMAGKHSDKFEVVDNLDDAFDMIKDDQSKANK